MTKTVRIENADTSSYKVRLQAQEKNAAGEWVNSTEPPTDLQFPTALATVGITSHKRYIVEEIDTSVSPNLAGGGGEE